MNCSSGRACDLLYIPVDHQSEQDVVEAEYEVVFNELDHHRDDCIFSDRVSCRHRDASHE